ncbi:MAG: hypothetical protein JXM71_04180, partial [Spirochaetales bacterium]|nr:hypothetical protein [Spirochaetales bacterium]
MNNMIRFVSDALFDAFAFMAPLAPAAIGALATEYVGSLNIALEGLILAGAFTYVATGFAFGPVAGVLVALGATALLAFGADLFSRKAQADSFVVGLGVNMMVPALASILSLYLFGTKGVVVLPEIQT